MPSLTSAEETQWSPIDIRTRKLYLLPMTVEKRKCRNCDAELSGEYCSTCGQRDIELKVPLKELVNEFADEFLSFDARMLRSIVPFLFRPGSLTLEYVAGKRARYVSPFKLYFFMSFLYFFTAAVLGEPSDGSGERQPIAADSLVAALRMDSLSAIKLNKGMKLTFSKSDSATIERRFGHRFSEGLKKVKANPDLIQKKFHEHTPQVVFLLLPVFALLLKLMYIRPKSYYIQHIIFSFYFHAYVFFVLLVITLLGSINWGGITDYADLLIFALPLNLYLAMARVYRQSFGKTFLKFSLLAAMYGLILIAAVVVAVFTLVLSL